MFKFKRNEDGSQSIEAVFAIPILFIGITLTVVVWDAFKTLTVSQKANYAIADMLSREDTFNPDFVTTMHEIYDFLAHSQGANGVRVTVVAMEPSVPLAAPEMQLKCSWGAGDMSGHGDLSKISPRIPPMHDGEYLIVVESQQEWRPFFNIGLTQYRFQDVSITRPRFSPDLTCA